MKTGVKYVSSENVTDLTNLKESAHIRFKRSLQYYHHAIVTNINVEQSEYTVIHFTADENKYSNKRKAHIIEETLAFTDQSTTGKKRKREEEVLLVTYTIDELEIPQFKRLPPEASISVAKYFKDSPPTKSYNVLSNNCEHFVFGCTIGYAISFQKLKPLIFVFWAFNKVSQRIVNQLMTVLIMRNNKVVEYNEGDDHLYIILESGEKIKRTFRNKQ
ncbi:unnamed protein product [Mytilus edulis]|uniref:LRAT domain-containing protein n=1 Tax=Mytilus edulis TaxID=6550 RepID=A0A8S3PWM2_MYTED|nr:unnamed protein product [Mytilus edulis]